MTGCALIKPVPASLPVSFHELALIMFFLFKSLLIHKKYTQMTHGYRRHYNMHIYIDVYLMRSKEH